MPGANAAQLLALAAETPEEEIKQKPKFRKNKQTGQSYEDGSLDYIDARFVMDRFDTQVGPENWQNSFQRDPEGALRGGIGVLVDRGGGESEWVWKWDTGDESDIEGNKGEHSDALKRAAVLWGVARDLYGKRQASQKPAAKSTTRRRSTATQTAKDSAPPITDRQKRMLEGKMRDAGVTGDKRKAFILHGVHKMTSRDLTSQDVDTLVALLDAPRDEHPEVWDNVEIVSGDE